MNDTSQAFGSFPKILFRHTSPQELGATLLSLGAYQKPNTLPWPGWLLGPSAHPSLEFEIIEDVAGYAVDLVSEAWEEYMRLLEALGVMPEDALILIVAVRAEASALTDFRAIALELLENHPGVVKDSNAGQVWTREAIASDLLWSERAFFGEDGAVIRGTDTA